MHVCLCVQVRMAVGVGRLALDPLAIIAVLCGPKKGVLSLKMHDLQDMLPKEALAQRLEQVRRGKGGGCRRGSLGQSWNGCGGGGPCRMAVRRVVNLQEGGGTFKCTAVYVPGVELCARPRASLMFWRILLPAMRTDAHHWRGASRRGHQRNGGQPLAAGPPAVCAGAGSPQGPGAAGCHCSIGGPFCQDAGGTAEAGTSG